MDALETLQKTVVSCTRCPRLVVYRQAVAQKKRRMYMDWEYWGKPVPSFGDPDARLLIIGLVVRLGIVRRQQDGEIRALALG